MYMDDCILDKIAAYIWKSVIVKNRKYVNYKINTLKYKAMKFKTKYYKKSDMAG